MPTNITESLSRSFVPQAAIIVYKNNDNPYYKDETYYIESRKIREDGSLDRAAPVTRKFLNALVKNFSAEEAKMPHGVMPPNMLYADFRTGQEKFVWWNPPQKRHLYFSPAISMEDGDYNMPGTIYMAHENKLSVWAFAGKKPNLKTVLLYGPYFNYYESGDICLGSARVEWPEDITWQDIQEHWEKMFWGSINSHSMYNPMVKGANLTIALKEAMKSPFNTLLLQKTSKTLKSILA